MPSTYVEPAMLGIKTAPCQYQSGQMPVRGAGHHSGEPGSIWPLSESP
jgi:hypothetical protein